MKKEHLTFGFYSLARCSLNVSKYLRKGALLFKGGFLYVADLVVEGVLQLCGAVEVSHGETDVLSDNVFNSFTGG